MQSTSPIFKSTEQALFVAFLIQSLPATQRSVMQAIFEANMGRSSDEGGGAVNFSGLSAQEVRGQCSMVVGAVRDHCTQTEADAIRAKWAYQKEKADGVRGVRDYCLPMMATGHLDATLAMAWAVFGTERQRKEVSTAAIARQWGLVQQTVSRDVKRIRETAQRMQQQGIDRLRPMFERDGLVGAQ